MGFERGNLVFVTTKDKMMDVSTRLDASSSIDDFLDGLEKSNLDDVIQKLQGFTIYGIIKY